MKSFRKKMSEEYPEMLTYGCSAHYLNLLGKIVTPQTVLKHIVEIQTYMRNHHIPHGLLKKKGGVMPQIPNDTRWNSQLACLNTFNRNYLIYREINKEDPTVIEERIGNKLNGMNLYKNSLDLEEQIKIVENVLDQLQKDNATLKDLE